MNSSGNTVLGSGIAIDFLGNRLVHIYGNMEKDLAKKNDRRSLDIRGTKLTSRAEHRMAPLRISPFRFVGLATPAEGRFSAMTAWLDCDDEGSVN